MLEHLLIVSHLVLMEEQKLTMFQRNKVNYNLRNGEPLPPPRKPSSYRQANDYEEQLAYEIMLRAKSARKRTLVVIKASGAFETEKYVIECPDALKWSTDFLQENVSFNSDMFRCTIPKNRPTCRSRSYKRK